MRATVSTTSISPDDPAKTQVVNRTGSGGQSCTPISPNGVNIAGRLAAKGTPTPPTSGSVQALMAAGWRGRRGPRARQGRGRSTPRRHGATVSRSGAAGRMTRSRRHLAPRQRLPAQQPAGHPRGSPPNRRMRARRRRTSRRWKNCAATAATINRPGRPALPGAPPFRCWSCGARWRRFPCSAQPAWSCAAPHRPCRSGR